MLDDKIIWRKGVNLKDFRGIDIVKNGKQNGYDVFGLLKSSREVWLKIGYLTLQGRDIRGAIQMFMVSLVYTLPFFFWMMYKC